MSRQTSGYILQFPSWLTRLCQTTLGVDYFKTTVQHDPAKLRKDLAQNLPAQERILWFYAPQHGVKLGELVLCWFSAFLLLSFAIYFAIADIISLPGVGMQPWGSVKKVVLLTIAWLLFREPLKNADWRSRHCYGYTNRAIYLLQHQQAKTLINAYPWQKVHNIDAYPNRDGSGDIHVRCIPSIEKYLVFKGVEDCLATQQTMLAIGRQVKPHIQQYFPFHQTT